MTEPKIQMNYFSGHTISVCISFFDHISDLYLLACDALCYQIIVSIVLVLDTCNVYYNHDRHHHQRSNKQKKMRNNAQTQITCGRISNWNY